MFYSCHSQAHKCFSCFRNLNQELWIAKMTKPDSGLYSCKANNKYGSIKSQPVLVDIVGELEIKIQEFAYHCAIEPQ
jgi:hypothetical protein